MFEITVYSFEDAQGVEQEFRTQDENEAQQHTEQHGLRGLRNVYELTDSEPAWDFTGQSVEV